MKYFIIYLVFVNIFLFLSVNNSFIYAQQANEQSTTTKENRKSISTNITFVKKLKAIRKLYVTKKISDDKFLKFLMRAYLQIKKDNKLKPYLLELLKYTVEFLYSKSFFILSSHLTAVILKHTNTPWDTKYLRLWNILYKPVIKYRIYDDILSVIESLDTRKLIQNNIVPKPFGNDWYYLLGMYYADKNKFNEATQYFKKLSNHDRFFIPALYELALVYLKQDDIKSAKNVFKIITQSSTANVRKLSSSAMREFKNYAFLNLGRLEYEDKNFRKALKYFRSVSKNSYLFYDALYMQAWALFMEGYVNYALGALHAVDSPFYVKRYNPESSILRSLIYYWICDYDEAKGALADFVDRYSQSIKELTNFVNYSTLSWKVGYDLFDNAIGQKVIENIHGGVPLSIVKEIIINDVVFPLRQELYAVLAEYNKFLRRRILFEKSNSFKYFNTYYDKLIKYYQKKLGTVIIDELKEVEQKYKQKLYEANFLYVELLMSEKVKVEGGELHADTKILDIRTNERIKGWSKYPMPWKASTINEYWWDEMGFYVYTVSPNCNLIDTYNNQQDSNKNERIKSK